MRAAKAICLGTILLAGCATPGPTLKTPMPEQIVIPPEDDPRYSKPVEYPKEMLNKAPIKPMAPGVGGPGGRSPGGPSMGGGGGMPGGI